MSRHPVIAISGPPGAGKTTLAARLASRLDAELVEYDRHETMTDQPPEAILDWLERGAPYDEIVLPGLADAVARAAERAPVVFDTMVGRAHPDFAVGIDLAIWIDIPAEVALARKIGQFARDLGEAEPRDFMSWLRGYTQAYENVVRPACEIQKARLRGSADLIVNGLDAQNVLENQCLAHLVA